MAEEKKQPAGKGVAGKLSKSERSLSYWAGFFMLLVILDNLILRPLVNKNKDMEEEISRERMTIKDGLIIIGRKDNIVNAYEQLKVYFTEEAKTDSEEFGDLFRDIEMLATTTGIRLIATNRASEEPEKSKYFTKYEVKIDFTGSMENVTKFIYELSAGPNLTKIVSLDLMPAGKTAEELKCTAFIARQVVPL
jgi:hypothetical protein